MHNIEIPQSTNRSGWRLDKTISITHIIMIVPLAVSMIAGYFTLTNRLSLNEQAIVVIVDKINRQDKDFSEYKNSVREDLKEINQKLDRIIERN